MTYDAIGGGYAVHCRADPRIAALVHEALGDAASVVNVGAGAGSYEPADRFVVAVEPSTVMLRQRSASAAPAVRAVAEALPFPDDAFDAALVVLSVHHWADRAAGYAELRRVARRRVVLTFDNDVHRQFWLIAEYAPEVAATDDAVGMTIAETADGIGATRVVPVPLPHDCVDAVLPAHWRRPEAYLDPGVRAAGSGLASLDAATGERMTTRLAADLASGRWHERHADLLDADTYDAGFRLLIAD
ncbi:MAG: class I SAM-dependent methyltransferase [Actinobacteria bacterium]|nr:class I SAM-dependent methyltransferase [Actinomycetota bacterium]